MEKETVEQILEKMTKNQMYNYIKTRDLIRELNKGEIK